MRNSKPPAATLKFQERQSKALAAEHAQVERVSMLLEGSIKITN